MFALLYDTPLNLHLMKSVFRKSQIPTVVTTNYDQRQSPFQMTSTPDPEIVQISTPEGPQTKEEPVEEEESANLAIYSFLINNIDAIINKLGIPIY